MSAAEMALADSPTINLNNPIHWQDWWKNPYPLYKRLRDEAPVYYDEQSNSYLITRYDDNWNVLCDFAKFSNIPFYLKEHPENSITPFRNADPPRHTWMRQIVSPLFTPRAMRNLTPYFNGLADELLDAAEEGNVVEVSTQLAIPLPGRVTCDIIGLPKEFHKLFLDLTAERLALLGAQSGRAGVSNTRSFDEVRADLWAILEPIANQRRRDPQNDAITLCFQAQDQMGKAELSDQLIIDMLLALLTGGFHTTQHLIEMLMDLFADRDDLWQQMRADPSLAQACIEEMLRFDAPVQALPRFAYDAQEVAGFTIPAGSTLQMVFGSANRDERVFSEPDEFSLDRKVNRHTAFAVGVHHCPGAPVSRFETRALLEKMLHRYQRIERAGPSERMKIEMNSVGAMHGVQNVPVRLIRA